MTFAAISTAFFCWFFAYSLDNVPYLKWYGRLIDRLPYHMNKPLGRCPFCMAPWLFLLYLITKQNELIHTLWQVPHGFGWVYAANEAFGRYFAPAD